MLPSALAPSTDASFNAIVVSTPVTSNTQQLVQKKSYCWSRFLLWQSACSSVTRKTCFSRSGSITKGKMATNDDLWRFLISRNVAFWLTATCPRLSDVCNSDKFIDIFAKYRLPPFQNVRGHVLTPNTRRDTAHSSYVVIPSAMQNRDRSLHKSLDIGSHLQIWTLWRSENRWRRSRWVTMT